MKRLLLLAALGFPAAALAQRRDEPGTEGPYSLKYRKGYYIGRPSYLYRTLREARSGRHYAHRVQPGDQVFAAQRSSDPHWLRVARTTYKKGTTPKGDTAVYYLPAIAIKDQVDNMATFDTQ